MKIEDTTFVLVHDAWHALWEWDAVQQILSNRGWKSAAIDLPGHGKLYKPGEKGYTLNDYGTVIKDEVLRQGTPNVVLVAHGTSGPACQLAYEQIIDEHTQINIVGIIFVGAFIVNDGKSIADNMPVEMVEFFKKLAESRDDEAVSMEAISDFWRYSIMSDDIPQS